MQENVLKWQRNGPAARRLVCCHLPSKETSLGVRKGKTNKKEEQRPRVRKETLTYHLATLKSSRLQASEIVSQADDKVRATRETERAEANPGNASLDLEKKGKKTLWKLPSGRPFDLTPLDPWSKFQNRPLSQWFH